MGVKLGCSRRETGWLCVLLLVGCLGATPSSASDVPPVVEEVSSCGPDSPNGCTPPPVDSPNAAWCRSSPPKNGLPLLSVRGTLDRGNAVGVHGCREGAYSHYEHRTGGAQLHVIGVYQGAKGQDGHRHVKVRVTRPGSSVLVLSSYEEATWEVELGPQVSVERIVVNGYEPQRVTAPKGIPVEVRSYEQTESEVGPYGHEWPASSSTQLVNASEKLARRELTSFRGCYESGRFEIGTPERVRPPNTVLARQEPTVPVKCEQLTAESIYCMTINNNTPTVVGLESGQTCSGVPAKVSGLDDVSSLGWQGNYLYTCIRERGLARISLVDGSVDIAPVACEAVASHREGLLTLLGHDGTESSWEGALVHFESLEAAARQDSSCLRRSSPRASRMTVHGDQGYFAWHSTDTISTLALDKTDKPRSIVLKEYDGWILGMSVLDDGRLVILAPGSGTRSARLLVFDSKTGASLGAHSLRLSDSGGLVCRRGRKG
jgi:hypothetical protein